MKQICDLEARATADEPVLYADEVDIDKNPKIGRAGCFADTNVAF